MDVGCGVGGFLGPLSAFGRVVGLELDEPSIAWCRDRGFPGTAVALSQREHRGQRGRSRMREQAIHAILRDRQLRVVVVVGVDRDAVGKRRKARRQLERRSDDRAAAVGRAAKGAQILAHDVTGFGRVAGERQAEAVQDRALAEAHHVLRDVARPCGR